MKTTSSSGAGARVAHALGEGLEEQRMLVERMRRASSSMPLASAAAAASKYLPTLSVENCGASGMPMMRETPAAAQLRRSRPR